MQKRVVLWKEVGETPLMALERYTRLHGEYANIPATYAGRLDPMAEGKLLVLLGSECKKQDHYRGLDKEYVVEVLLDAGSDTGDALGLVQYSGKETRVDPRVLQQVLATEKRVHTHPYPAFSSKTVDGKPLFMYALEGTLDTITIPEHQEHIYTLSHQDTAHIDTKTLRERIDTFLAQVPRTDEPSKALGADFRIDTVRESWDALIAQAKDRHFSILTLRVVCGSGTYMRTLAGRVGEALGTTALALSIRRTRIGKQRFGIFFDLF